MKKIKENWEKLHQRPQIHDMVVGKRRKSPVKGYKFNDGVAKATEWQGDATQRIYQAATERPILQLSHKDGFRCLYEMLNDHGSILVVYFPETNAGKLCKHMKNVGTLLFDHHGVSCVSARAHPPRVDGAMQGPDRREETVSYHTPSGWEERTRLFKMWITVCQRMCPEDTGNSDADADALTWISPHFELNDEERELLNSKLPTHHRWLF